MKYALIIGNDRYDDPKLAQLKTPAADSQAPARILGDASIGFFDEVTPLINQPEVAILGVSRGSIEPVWREGAFVPREMLPLSLSYDHRAIDGANAARFTRFVADALEQPLSLYV